jgi:hypothetical protein
MPVACSDTPGPTVTVQPRATALTAAAAIPYATDVHVSAIPALDGSSVHPAALNDWGEIVGWLSTDSISGAAFKWQGSRGLRMLSLPGGEMTSASGVNDVGDVAVTIVAASGLVPAIWGWFGDVRRLPLLSTYTNPTLSAPYCRLNGINNRRVAVGTCTLADGTSRPTVWTKFGTPSALHAGGGAAVINGQAFAISDSGFVVGFDGISAFVFAPNGRAQSLPPAQASYAVAVNDSGWTAGFAFDTITSNPIASVWLRGDSLHGFGMDGQTNGITDDGVAVGSLGNLAFVWTAATGLRLLPGLEGGSALAKEHSVALAINRVHQILGQITLSTGLLRTVIWTLPGSALLARAGRR